MTAPLPIPLPALRGEGTYSGRAVQPSRTQSHQSNPEDATEANEASLSRSDLASRQFPFVTFCSNLCTPLLYARFSRNFAPTSAARSSRSHPVKPIGDSQRSSLPVKPVALSQRLVRTARRAVHGHLGEVSHER